MQLRWKGNIMMYLRKPFSDNNVFANPGNLENFGGKMVKISFYV